MKSCCIQGSLHSGEPVGTVTTLHGLPCYISEPPAGIPPKALIVFLPDAFGWEMPNNRLLADRYARRSEARVYLPEFMNGGGFPSHLMDTMRVFAEPSPSWGAVLWEKVPAAVKTLYHASTRLPLLRDASCRPRIVSFLGALRENEAAATEGQKLKIGVAGFCWGGHHTFDLCAGLTMPSNPSQPLIDAGFTAHPSWLQVPVDFENVKLPICVTVGDVDFALAADKCRDGKEVLDLKGDKERWDMRIVNGAKHGFALRWDVNDENEMQMAQEAEDLAVEFWARWLGTAQNDK